MLHRSNKGSISYRVSCKLGTDYLSTRPKICIQTTYFDNICTIIIKQNQNDKLLNYVMFFENWGYITTRYLATLDFFTSVFGLFRCLTCSLDTGDGGIIITSLGLDEVDSLLSRSEIVKYLFRQKYYFSKQSFTLS